MIRSFKSFLKEEQKSVHVSFETMNPPTREHEKKLDEMKSKGSFSSYKVFMPEENLKLARKLFPRHARSIITNENVNSIEDAVKVLETSGYKNVIALEPVNESYVIESARQDDFTKFSQCLAEKTTTEEARSLFNCIRKDHGLKETQDFRNNVNLGNLNEVRERYLKGELWQENDEVVIAETNEVATVVHCGPNYVIIEQDGKKSRKWLDSLLLPEGNE